MKITKSKFLYLIVIIMLFSNISWMQQHNEIVTGVYSNLMLNKESGDIVGIELFVIYSQEGYFVVFQSSEGVPSIPKIM